MKRDHRYGEKLPKAVCGPNAVTAALRGVKWKGKGEALLVRPHASNAPQECKCNAVLAALRRGGEGGRSGEISAIAAAYAPAAQSSVRAQCAASRYSKRRGSAQQAALLCAVTHFASALHECSLIAALICRNSGGKKVLLLRFRSMNTCILNSAPALTYE